MAVYFYKRKCQKIKVSVYKLKPLLFFMYYLFNTSAVLGTCYFAWFPLVVTSNGYPSLQCLGFSLWRHLLLLSTSLRFAGFSRCSIGDYSLCGLGGPPGLGIDPTSPALAGRLLFTAPPGKSLCLLRLRKY